VPQARSWVQFPMASLGFFIDLTIPAALRPPTKMSTSRKAAGA